MNIRITLVVYYVYLYSRGHPPGSLWFCIRSVYEFLIENWLLWLSFLDAKAAFVNRAVLIAIASGVIVTVPFTSYLYNIVLVICLSSTEKYICEHILY